MTCTSKTVLSFGESDIPEEKNLLPTDDAPTILKALKEHPLGPLDPSDCISALLISVIDLLGTVKLILGSDAFTGQEANIEEITELQADVEYLGDELAGLHQPTVELTPTIATLSLATPTDGETDSNPDSGGDSAGDKGTTGQHEGNTSTPGESTDTGSD